MAARIAFLGLGHMGLPMARNLVAAGNAVSVWNRTPARAVLVPEARAAATIADAVHDAEIAITMLANDAAVREVVFGDGGLLATLPRGAVHVGMSTVSVALAEELARAHPAAGQRFVAAPVFGRPDAAERRQLWLVPGGAEADIQALTPIFEVLGRGATPMPEARLAALTKILGNFIIAGLIEMLGEATTAAERAGLDPERFMQVVNALMPTPMVERYGGLVARTEFRPAGFALPLGLKDINLALEAAGTHRVPLPLADIIRDHMLAALAHGRDDWDWAGLASAIRENAGLPPVR